MTRPILFLSFLLLYLIHLAPGITLIDCSEVTTAIHLLGNPHSPGYPTVCLLGKPFTFLPLGSVAYRTNLMSAVCGALSVAALHWTARRFGFRQQGALFAAILWGVSGTLWSQSVTTEVYAAAMLALIVALGLLSPAPLAKDRGDFRPLAAAVLLVSAASGLHQMLLFALPALAASAWFRYRGSKLTAGTAAVCLAAAVLGLSVQLYLPLRAAAGAEYAWERPDSWDAFWGLITTRTFHGQRGVRSLAALGEQLRNFARIQLNEFGPAALAACALGAFATWRTRKRAQLVVLVLLWAVDAVAALLLFNIPSGWLFFVNVFFLPGFIACCLWFGGLWDWPDRWRAGTFAVAAAVTLIVFFTHQPANDRSQCYLLHDWTTGVLDTVPANGMLILQRDETFPLSYAQLIERRRLDVIALHWMIGRDPQGWAGRDALRRHPGLRLPVLPGWQGEKPGELAAFVQRLTTLNHRPLLMTSLDPELTALSVVPRGLLYMIKDSPAVTDIRDGIAWWTRYSLRDARGGQQHHEPADEELVQSYRDAWQQGAYAAAAAGLPGPPGGPVVARALSAGW